MKKETPKSYERSLYESCPALAKYESAVLGEKQWVEMLDQKSRNAANMLMPHNQPGEQPQQIPPDLLMYMRRFIKDYGQGDEGKGVQTVFNALIAAGGHRHAANLTAFLSRLKQTAPANV